MVFLVVQNEVVKEEIEVLESIFEADFRRVAGQKQPTIEIQVAPLTGGDETENTVIAVLQVRYRPGYPTTAYVHRAVEA
jgi:hypothetical protein